MAAKPTPGGSDGTYGDELNEFLDVSLADDGKIKTEALQTDATAPVADAALTNKKFVTDLVTLDANGVLMHDAEGGFSNCDLSINNGGSFTETKVYTKYITGTSDASTTTEVAHSISSALTKILHVSGAISIGTAFFVYEYDKDSALADRGFQFAWNATNIVFTAVEAAMQSQTYVIKIDYIL